jgi:hypothetical protein
MIEVAPGAWHQAAQQRCVVAALRAPPLTPSTAAKRLLMARCARRSASGRLVKLSDNLEVSDN